MTNLNKEDYRLVPAEVLDRIQDITDQEQERIESQVKHAHVHLKAMYDQAQHNKKVLVIYTLSLIIQTIIIAVAVLK